MSVRGGALRSGGSVALLALLLLLAPLALFPSGGPPGAPHASTTVGPSRAGALGTAGPRVGQANTCPNQNYYGSGTQLSLAQTVDCAGYSGFTGNLEITFVSMAYQESTFCPGAIESGSGTCSHVGPGCSGQANAEGILQEGTGGQCPPSGGPFSVPSYSPSSCSTWSGSSSNWGGIYFNPQCSFQWALAYYNYNGYAFWGSYLSGAYCMWAPNGFLGTGSVTCSGTNQNQANLPWSTVCPNNVCPTPSSLAVSYAMQDTTTGGALTCGGSFATGDAIQFTATVSGGTSPYTYAWAFGDGSTSSSDPATHTYTAPGSVNPTLQVTDSGGNTASTGTGCSFTVTGMGVTVSATDVTTSLPLACGATFSSGDTISFSAQTQGGVAPFAYAWTFGDGGTATVNPATHVYAVVGTVTPTVTVTDAAGASASAGAGCTYQVSGTSVAIATVPAGVGSVQVGGSSYTDGQSVTLPVGASVALATSAPAGYIFAGWTTSGGISVAAPNSPTTQVDVTGSAAATLTLDLVASATVLVAVSPAGSGSASIGGSTYAAGQNFTGAVGTVLPLQALPSPGYAFLAWNISGPGAAVANAAQASTNLTLLSASPTTLTEVLRWDAPQAPLDLRVTGATSASLDLAWTPPPGALLAYHVGFAPGSAPPSGTTGFTVQSFPAGGSSSTLTGLTPATQYWVELAGVNGTGEGQWSGWVTGTTVAVPEPPVDLSLVALGSSFALLGWQLPPGGSSIDGFTLRCTPSSASPVVVAGIPPSSTDYNATGLLSGTTYACSMVSVAGTFASAPSNTVTFTTTGTPPGSGSSSGGPGGGGWVAVPLQALERSLTTPYLYIWAVLALALIAIVALAAVRRRRSRAGRLEAEVAGPVPPWAGGEDPGTPLAGEGPEAAEDAGLEPAERPGPPVR